MMRLSLLLVVTWAGCAAGPPPRVNPAAEWPGAAPGWSDAQKAWTRRAVARGELPELSSLIRVAATLESAEWRAAYSRERARRLHLAPEEETRFVAAQKAAAAETWEVELLVATAKPEWNDLRKGTGSMWRLALASGDGREVTPISVVEDRRSRAEIEAYFPDLQTFYQAYVVKFPARTPDGQPLAGGKLVLKIASGVGAVELVWGS